MSGCKGSRSCSGAWGSVPARPTHKGTTWALFGSPTWVPSREPGDRGSSTQRARVLGSPGRWAEHICGSTLCLVQKTLPRALLWNVGCTPCPGPALSSISPFLSLFFCSHGLSLSLVLLFSSHCRQRCGTAEPLATWVSTSTSKRQLFQGDLTKWRVHRNTHAFLNQSTWTNVLPCLLSCCPFLLCY